MISRWFICMVLFMVIAMDPASGVGDDPVIRIAIFQMAPEEGNFTVNHAMIEKAITVASVNGADWFLTPEMAESGYEFLEHMTLDDVPEFPSSWFEHLATLAEAENITLFIGFPERSGGKYYNAVAMIDHDGNLSGIHQKIEIIPGPNEGWATPGDTTPLMADDHTIGYYICADVANASITDDYIAAGADIMLSSAAWYPDPTMGPEEYWKSVTGRSGVPLVIANTVGKKGEIDFTHAESGVYQNNTTVYTVPASEQVVAFVDWNPQTGTIRPGGLPVLIGNQSGLA